MDNSKPGGAAPTATRLTLRVPGSPRGKVGDLTLTLNEVHEDTRVEGGRLRRSIAARLTAERGTEARSVSLQRSAEVFGWRLALADAGDGQAGPGGPHEIFAVIDVTPAP